LRGKRWQVKRALDIDKAGGGARRLRGWPSSVNFACRLSLDAGGNRHAITILIYDRGMPVSVNVQTVYPRKVAAVRREVAPGAVVSAWGPAVGQVWDFIRNQPGLWTDGHNIFLYHHPKQPGAPILCEFGVEVTRTFENAGEVYATETPGGEAAVAVHRGPYNRMNEEYNAIEKWIAANRRESAGHSWEIYGDPTPDPADTETTVVHLLK
jgi:effector-binding domain-containing protein